MNHLSRFIKDFLTAESLPVINPSSARIQAYDLSQFCLLEHLKTLPSYPKHCRSPTLRDYSSKTSVSFLNVLYLNKSFKFRYLRNEKRFSKTIIFWLNTGNADFLFWAYKTGSKCLYPHFLKCPPCLPNFILSYVSSFQTLAERYFPGQRTPGLHQKHIVNKTIMSEYRAFCKITRICAILRSVSLLLWA